MNQKIENLISVLQQSLAIYGEMLPLMADERKAALEGDVETINRQSVEKESLISKLKALEKDRVLVLKELSTQLHCPQANLTMGYLVGRVEPGYRAQLDGIHSALHALLLKISEFNKENQMYINHILKVVKNGLRFFDRASVSPSVYLACGNIDGVQRSHGLILSNTV